MATTAKQALKWVDRLYAQLSSRRAEIEKAFGYLDGKQPLEYASKEWANFHKDRYRDFSDNWCDVVAQAPIDRLRLDGIRIGDDVDEFSAEEKLLWDDWKRNEMEAQSSQGFLASIVAKRSAVLVWGDDNDEPSSTWEHPAQVIVAYAPGTNNRVRLAALKAWVDDQDELATLYLPDGVWKFRRSSALTVTNGRTPSGIHVSGTALANSLDWEPREVPDEEWPLENPFGEVPVVEFPNRPRLGADPISDIQGTMAMQDAINLMWGYLFNAADHASMPARVVIGAEPPKVPILDSLGQVIGSRPAKMEDLAKGRMLFLPGADSISQWDAAKLDVFTGVITQAIGHVAAQTRTPGHYMLTNEKFANLNGDALTAAEVPLVKKVEAEQSSFTPPARDVFRLYAKARGNDALAEQIRLATMQWKGAEMHTLAQTRDAAQKDKATGLPLAYILEKTYGLSQQEIDRVMDMRAAELAQGQDPIAAALLRDAGVNVDPDAGA